MKNNSLKAPLFVLMMGVLFVALTIAHAQESARNTLKVTYNLSGKVKDIANKELVVHFSHDMIPLGGKRKGKKILGIKPFVKGEFQWRGTKTLVFIPKTRFAYSTKYQVTIKKGTRSIRGKILHQDIQWKFTTPLPYPYLYRFSSMSYFDHIKTNKSHQYAWINDSLYFKFQQPVFITDVQKHLLITPSKWEKGPRLKCSQVNNSIIKITFGNPLPRDSIFTVIVKKGLKGVEGNLVTKKDFKFKFSTVPVFRCLGKKEFKLREDEERHIKFHFSIPLKNITKKDISVYKSPGSSRELHPVIVNGFSPEIWKDFLYIFFNERLCAGDELSIRLSKDIRNIYGEKLNKNQKINITVCSALPVVYPDHQPDGQLDLYLKNIKHMTYTLFKFKDTFLDLLAKQKRAVPTLKELKNKAKKKEYLDFEKTIKKNLNAKSTRHYIIDYEKETGAKNGFFGLMINQMEPFNHCREDKLENVAQQFPSKLAVFFKRDIDFILRTNDKNTLLWVYNNKTNQPVPNAEILITRKEKIVKTTKANQNGVWLTDMKLEPNDIILVKDPETREKTFYKLDKKNLDYEMDKDEPEIIVRIFSDRVLYKPGSTVYIGGVIKEYKSGKLLNPGDKKAALIINDPYGSEVKKDSLVLDEWGGFSYTFPLKKNLKKGVYEIYVKYKDEEYDDLSQYIVVDYYQPDTIKMEVTGLKKVYGKNDVLDALVTGYYLSGNPLAGSRLEYNLDVLGDFYPYFQEWEGNTKGYIFNLDPRFKKRDEEITAEQRFDSQGKHRTQIDLGKITGINYLAEIRLAITGESTEGKEFAMSESFGYFPGNRAVGIKLPSHITVNQPVKAQLAVIDNTGQLAETKAIITIQKNKTIYEYWNVVEWVEIMEFKDLLLKGKDQFEFTLWEPGSYILKCEAIDKEGGIIASSVQFQVDEAAYNKPKKDFQIDAADGQYEYREGETICLSLYSPAQHRGKALITVEKDKILDYFIIDLEPNTTTPFRFKVKENYFPAVKVNAAALFKDNIKTHYLVLEVSREVKTLDVVLTPQSKEIEPAKESEINVKITDHLGKGKKTRVFVYAVNEGNLQLCDCRLPDLVRNFYYHDSWNIVKKMAQVFSKDYIFPSLHSQLFGKKGKILVGRVTDKQGIPLENVAVSLKIKMYPKHKPYINHEVYQTVTNQDGVYLLGGLSPHFYEIIFKKQGYVTHKTQNKIETVKELNIQLLVQKEKKQEKEKKIISHKPKRKQLELDLKRGRRISGNVLLPDGSPVPGTLVVLISESQNMLRYLTTISNEWGFYSFKHIPRGEYKLLFLLEGFKTAVRFVTIKKTDIKVNAILDFGQLEEEIVVSGAAPEVDLRKTGIGLEKLSASLFDRKELQTLLRKDFQEVLFFRLVETDEEGNAVVSFKTSDMLSTYRVMAVAYSGDSFGSGDSSFLVSKKLYLEEAMPEFAREGDRFTAGVQVSNRFSQNLAVTVNALPDRIAIKDKKEKYVNIPGKANHLVPFLFKADQAGESEIEFYALTGSVKDGLLKKLPVYKCLVSESFLDFDAGKHIKKQIQPVKHGKESRLKLKIASSLLKPAAKIAEKLIFYPYECMEQRTSKVMPYLILDEAVIPQLQLKIDPHQLRESFKGYVKVIPEFMNKKGGMSYYRGGKHISGYLTIYVLWALRLGEQKGYEINPKVTARIENYVKETKFDPVNDCFCQFILSLNRQADPKKLLTYFKQREELPVTARVFLFKAINRQLKDKKKTKQMLLEFNNSLHVEADFAYFDVKEFRYNREFPFYSSRYVTAMLLQSILEVEGDYFLAPRIINWLLDAPAYVWHTTQTNFWILYAMHEYARQVEKPGLANVSIKVLDRHIEKKIQNRRDVIKVEKNLEQQEKTFDVDVKADQYVYLTTEITFKKKETKSKSRGIKVLRNVYDETGKPAKKFVKGNIYQVEILMELDKRLPYGVVDEPIAAGFEILRQDLATTRKLQEFNTDNMVGYYNDYWARKEHSADRIVYYSYMYYGKIRIVYFVKALYAGKFTWLPTVVQGMYHPQYYGRTASRQITVHPHGMGDL